MSAANPFAFPQPLPLTLTDYRAHLTRRLEERGVPEHLHRGLLTYFTERRKPGSFLRAVLKDSLAGAVSFADDESYREVEEK